ncbi:hypothetical protein GCM10027343_02390 [Noviherbaspirillum agri]
MTGLLLMFLAVVAIPIAVVMITVIATKSERVANLPDKLQPSLGKGSVSLMFGLAALLGVALILRDTGKDFATFVFLLSGIPAAAIAALLAALSYRLLVGRSKVAGAFAGLGVAVATVLTSLVIVAFAVAPGSKEGALMAAFGATIVLAPSGSSVLLIGVIAGVAVNLLANRNRDELT